METSLVKAMVRRSGDPGVSRIVPLSETPFYRFITSKEGLAQLGINPDDPPKLLDGYQRSFRTSIRGRSIVLNFGDEIVLKLNTPHPFAGRGRLRVSSWMEWIIDGKVVTDAGFVSSQKLPASLRKVIRVGGLMLPKGVAGSTGTWQFPPHLLDYFEDWFATNVKAIINAIEARFLFFLKKEIR